MTFNKFDYLDNKVSEIFDEILSQSLFIDSIKLGRVTKELFAIYLIETYHYTKHNPINQALVATRNINIPKKYRIYCYKHAREETGHENMVLNDIGQLGFNPQAVKCLKPLPETETLIAYLYWISTQGNPFQRLGYSYWAENCYRYINPVIERLGEVLSLTKKQLSFFIAHSSIDEKHAVEVANNIDLYCRTDEDFEDLAQVLETSLRLTGKILSAVYSKYMLSLENKDCRYESVFDKSIA